MSKGMNGISEFKVGEVIELFNYAGSRMFEKFKVTDVILLDGKEKVFIKKQGGWLESKPTYYNSPERIKESLVIRTAPITNKNKESS